MNSVVRATDDNILCGSVNKVDESSAMETVHYKIAEEAKLANDKLRKSTESRFGGTNRSKQFIANNPLNQLNDATRLPSRISPRLRTMNNSCSPKAWQKGLKSTTASHKARIRRRSPKRQSAGPACFPIED